MRVIVLLLISLGTLPAVACDGCLEILSDIRRMQKQAEQRLWETRALSAYAPDKMPVLSRGKGSPWAPVTTSSNTDDQVFFERLETKRSFEETKDRLNQIKAILTSLETEIDQEQAGLGDNPPAEKVKNLDRLKRLAQTQRLLIEELGRQLAAIHDKFVELDKRIDAHEARINAFEGDFSSLSLELRRLAAKIKAHAVSRKDAAFRDVQNFMASKQGEPTLSSHFWKFPRTELRLDEMDTHKVEFTSSIGGNLAGLAKGEAKGGVVYDAHLSTQTFLIAPGTAPLLSRNGSTLRNAALFCTVSKTFTIKGFGAVEANGGFDVGVVKSSTGVRYERGQTITATSKRYSEMMPVDQGRTFKEQQKICAKFTAQVARNEDLGAEIASMTRVVQVPETACYRDYDCRRDVQLGALKPTVISQCFVQKGRQEAVCRHRYVDVNGTCSLPHEAVYNFRYHCARGYTCDPQSRQCVRDLSGNDWLRSIGLQQAQVVSLKEHHRFVKPGDEGDKSSYCTKRYGLPAGDGWRLAKQDELREVALWFRDFAQRNIRQQHKRISAQSWFYPWQANKGMIWSDGPWVFLLSNDSPARYNPKDPENVKRFTDPKTNEHVAHGVGICVR